MNDASNGSDISNHCDANNSIDATISRTASKKGLSARAPATEGKQDLSNNATPWTPTATKARQQRGQQQYSKDNTKIMDAATAMRLVYRREANKRSEARNRSDFSNSSDTSNSSDIKNQ